MTRLTSGTFAKPKVATLSVHHRDEDFALGSFDNYLLALWSRQFHVRHIMLWTRAASELHALYPDDKIGALSLVEPVCSLPAPPEAVAQFAEVLGRCREWLGATCVAYEGQGFWGATVRSQVVNAHSESKAVVPNSFFTKLDSAAQWLVNALGDSTPVRALALCRAFDDLKAARAQRLSSRG